MIIRNFVCDHPLALEMLPIRRVRESTKSRGVAKTASGTIRGNGDYDLVRR